MKSNPQRSTIQWRHTRRLAALFVLLLPLISCSSAPSGSDVSLDVRWTPCDSRVEGGLEGTCARVRVPLAWEQSDGNTIEVEVKRIATSAVPRQGQLWLLDGGPGGSGWNFDHEVPLLRALLDSGWDLVIPSHRGTGYSTRLECPALDSSNSEHVGRCFDMLHDEWGDDLANFNSVQTAEDVRRLIAAIRVPGEAVALYGVSYGTYLAMRVVKDHPAAADAVILDSVAPLGFDAERQAVYADAVYARILAQCGADEVCAAELGAAPFERTQQLSKSLATKSVCPSAGWNRETLRAALLLSFSDAILVPVGLGAIRRLLRCSDSDAAELIQLRQLIESSMMEVSADDGSSWPLQRLVLAEDIIAPNLDVEALGAEFEDLLGYAELIPSRLYEWQRISDEERDNDLSTWSVPTLTIQGGIDLATPALWEQQFAEAASIKDDHRLFLPTGSHALLGSTEFAPCIGGVVEAFLSAPKAPLDRSCASEGPPLDLGGIEGATEAISRQLFGTPAIWGTP